MDHKAKKNLLTIFLQHNYNSNKIGDVGIVLMVSLWLIRHYYAIISY